MPYAPITGQSGLYYRTLLGRIMRFSEGFGILFQAAIQLLILMRRTYSVL